MTVMSYHSHLLRLWSACGGVEKRVFLYLELETGQSIYFGV